MRLGAIADVVRSKNAGIHYVTIDVLFHSRETYEAVRDTGVISRETVAAQYTLDPAVVRVFEYDAGLAFKATFPREHPAGSPADRDLYGAQQHVPMLDIQVPVDPAVVDEARPSSRQTDRDES